jgi:hypothetical protein
LLSGLRHVMSDAAVKCAATGKVVGYAECWAPSSSNMKALVQIGTSVVDVKIEFLQYEYLVKEAPVGSSVSVWSENGEWHMDSRPARNLFNKNFTGLLEKAGESALSIRRGFLGPTSEESSMEKLNSEVDADLDYIASSVGTLDLGIVDEDEYTRYVEREFLSRTDSALNRLDLSRVRERAQGLYTGP